MQANHGLGGKTANAIQIQRGGGMPFFMLLLLSAVMKNKHSNTVCTLHTVVLAHLFGYFKIFSHWNN